VQGAAGCRHAGRRRTECCLLGLGPRPGAKASPHGGREEPCNRATGGVPYALRHGSERVSGSKPEEMSLMIVFSIDFMSQRLGTAGARGKAGARGEGEGERRGCDVAVSRPLPRPSPPGRVHGACGVVSALKRVK
jgi:hypothetical protein